VKRDTACLWMVLLTTVAIAQTSGDAVILPEGTDIKVKMEETVTSRLAYVGERVELTVADDVVVGGALLVPRNTRVLGTVSVGKKDEGSRSNRHDVAIQIDYIRLGDRRILLTGSQIDKGKVNKEAAIAGAALLGVSGLLIAIDSRTGQIKEGTVMNATVAADVALPALGVTTKPEEVRALAPTSH
jgi:hypothetical protein